MGAQLWVTELAPFQGQRRYQVDGWISDWRRRAGADGTSVGFAFELSGARVQGFHLLVHGHVRPVPEARTIEDAVRKLQVAVKIAQGRLVLLDRQPESSP